jgi:hypothetical protein
VQAILDDLVKTKLMVEMDGQYLSLAVVRDRAARKRPEGRYDDISLQAAQAT